MEQISELKQDEMTSAGINEEATPSPYALLSLSSSL